MKLSGSYRLNVKKEIVWESLNDAKILKQCIPGCESFEKESDTDFKASATNQIGPMNSTFSGTVTLSNINKNNSYTISGEGQSSVGFANGSADVKIEEANGKTTLSYIVNVNVGGKIAQSGSRLISGVSEKMANYFFSRFADLVDPIIKNNESKKTTGSTETTDVNVKIEKKRVKELKSNFLNKYIYSILTILILLLVVIFYSVSR